MAKQQQRTRRELTPALKVKVLRELYVNRVEHSNLIAKYSLHPSYLSRWAAQLWEEAERFFSRNGDAPETVAAGGAGISELKAQNAELKAQIARKDALLLRYMDTQLQLEERIEKLSGGD